MAENDSHYNGVTDTTVDQNNGQEAVAGSPGAAVPLPDFEEGPPAYPGNDGSTSTSGGDAVIPLPFPGEGGPVYPGNDNTPVIPLPFPGEGGPVYPGNNNHIPTVPLPFPGEGGPVYPGNNSHIPTVPLPFPGEGGPVYPGNNTCFGGCFPFCSGCQTISPQYYGQVRFLNASTNSFQVNISIDNTTYAAGSRFGTISGYEWIADGFHTVTVRRASGLRSILLQQTFPFTAGQKVTFVLTDAAPGGLDLVRVMDTGCNNLPVNSGCFRFANMTHSGSSYDLLLTGGSTVFRNVGFQKVSPYKQAVAGSYRFTITRSNSYGFIQELPVIVIGAVTGSLGISNPVLTFDTSIGAGRNYTAYLIGNTWSNYNLQVITVMD